MNRERQGNVVHVRHHVEARPGDGIVLAFILCGASGFVMGGLVGLLF